MRKSRSDAAAIEARLARIDSPLLASHRVGLLTHLQRVPDERPWRFTGRCPQCLEPADGAPCPRHGEVDELAAAVGGLLAVDLQSAVAFQAITRDCLSEALNDDAPLIQREYSVDVACEMLQMMNHWMTLMSHPEAAAACARDAEGLAEEHAALLRLSVGMFEGRRRGRAAVPPAVALDLDLAQARAARKLLSFLSPRQRIDLADTGSFTVRGGDGHRYRIIATWHGNVVRLGPAGEALTSFCGNCGMEEVPLGDGLLAQAFMLSASPRPFFEAANEMPARDGGLAKVDFAFVGLVQRLLGRDTPAHSRRATRVRPEGGSTRYHASRGATSIAVPSHYAGMWARAAALRASRLGRGGPRDAELVLSAAEARRSGVITSRTVAGASGRLAALGTAPKGVVPKEHLLMVDPVVLEASRERWVVREHSDLCPMLQGHVSRPAWAWVAFVDARGESQAVRFEGVAAARACKAVEELDGLCLTDVCLPHSLHWVAPDMRHLLGDSMWVAEADAMMALAHGERIGDEEEPWAPPVVHGRQTIDGRVDDLRRRVAEIVRSLETTVPASLP